TCMPTTRRLRASSWPTARSLSRAACPSSGGRCDSRLRHCVAWVRRNQRTEAGMAESVYTVVELIGTSTQSWEKAAAAAVKQASQSLRDLRVAEVVELDMALDEGKVTAYRAKVKASFKYQNAHAQAKSAPAKSAPAPA